MDKFDLKKYLTEGKLLKEEMSLEMGDDYVKLSTNSGFYGGDLNDDGTVDFSVVYYGEDNRNGRKFDKSNWKEMLGPDHAFVKISNQIPTEVEYWGKDHITVKVDLEDLKGISDSAEGSPWDTFYDTDDLDEGGFVKENRGRDIGTPEELKSFLYSKQSQIVSWVKETLSEFGKENISWEEDIKQWIADDAGEITPNRFNLTSDDFNNRGYDEYMFEDVYKEFVKSTYDKFFSKELNKSSSTYSKLYPGGKIIARRDLEGHDNSFNKPLKVTIKEGTVLEIPNQLTKRGDLFCDILKGTIIVTEEGENREYGVGTKVGLVEGWKSEMYELGSTADKDWINYPGPSAMD